MKFKDVCQIILLIIATILYCVTLFIRDVTNGLFSEIMNIISIIIFIIVIIVYTILNVFLKKEVLKNCYYNMFHFIFVLLPFGMFLQYKYINNNIIIYISLLFTTILSLLLNNKLKSIDIKHIYNLKYSNILLLTIFTIFIALLDLKSRNIELYIYITCIAPFLILQVIYEKIIKDKTISNDNEPKIITDGKDKIISNNNEN